MKEMANMMAPSMESDTSKLDSKAQLHSYVCLVMSKLLDNPEEINRIVELKNFCGIEDERPSDISWSGRSSEDGVGTVVYES
ncbi:hypothetical protein V6N12_026717 [Hibiscus sabdariffa]|uniref:Uncharacterized protein n=1 Tax=Hibiscus sabdariffa TaxID=183260 RepID=A0ABR2DSK6_9ROSI